MAASFISEPLTPDASFDPLAMARGEPGLPAKFRWRDHEISCKIEGVSIGLKACFVKKA